MPELPEAETIRRQLEREVLGAVVHKVDILVSRCARQHHSPREVVRLVQGRRIERVGRRGKAVLLFLNGQNPTTLIIRLGMTGLIQVVSKTDPLAKAAAAVLELTDGRQIRFLDQRQFGELSARVGHDVHDMPEFLDYGPEPLSDSFTPEYLKEIFARRSAKIESVLMDQHAVAGIGKIYADEICFRAGLRPGRSVKRLTGPMRERLWRATRGVLREAVRCRGSSAADETYRDVYGIPGQFQERLSVYQRTGQACRVCGTAIRRTPMPGGRGMHWCPKCQV